MNSPTARWNCCSIDGDVAAPRPAREVLASAAARLAFLPREEARAEAEVLLAHVLRLERTVLYAHPTRPVAPAVLRALDALLRRRARREPLQYLTRRVGFLDFDLVVDRRVLIPRPETELVVEAALDPSGAEALERFADVGTGSGCIAIALARARPEARGVATDVSAGALEMAAENARRLGVAERLEFLEGDLLAPALARQETFDLVCSNPPYVTPEEYAALPPEIRDYEPVSALVAPGGGRDLYRRLFAEAAACLRPGGRVVVEVADGACAWVAALAAETPGLAVAEVRRDLAGIERVLVAQREG